MALSAPPASPRPRNPGPSWGYSFLAKADALLPRPIFDFLLGIGTGIAVAVMPAERGHSRAYLGAILGRPARLDEVFRHFYAFAQILMLRLRVGEGADHPCTGAPGCEAFLSLVQSGQSALLGTFHFGHSDLIGFMLGPFQRRVHMLRLRVENSSDTNLLAGRFGDSVTYLWVNERQDLLYALKGAIEAGALVAMKCDRPEFSSKLEPFQFLGRSRLFPFTIYHLALIFRLPVVLCVGVPGEANGSLVHSSPPFLPDREDREENLARARAHFQAFLDLIEKLLRQDPYQWFNFTEMNPEPASAKSGHSGVKIRPAEGDQGRPFKVIRRT
jgi:predicted LPLAT superfamily acyltransferase